MKLKHDLKALNLNNLVNISGDISNPLTIGAKIQTIASNNPFTVNLGSSLSNVMTNLPVLKSDNSLRINSANECPALLNPTYQSSIASASITLNESIGSVQNLAINTGHLAIRPSDNFITDPVGTFLGIALNAAGKHTEILTGVVQNQFDLGSGLSVIQDSTNILKLNNFALDQLNQQHIFPSILQQIPSVTDEIKRINDKIKVLEVNLLKEETKKRTIEISEITNKIRDLLKKFGNNITEMFDGAYQVLLDDDNKERIPQSAESMSRLIEFLPEVLCEEKPPCKDKASIIAFRLTNFLGIDNSKESINHNLITRQHLFYDVFGNIRHRDKSVKPYLEDINRYKALLLQTEAYLYELLTFKEIL